MARSHKAEIKRLLGIPNDPRRAGFAEGEKLYKKLYSDFYNRVNNYNAATGENRNPATEFYYNVKFRDKLRPTQQAIAATPATRPHKAGERAGIGKAAAETTARKITNINLKAFDPLADAAPELRNARARFLSGEKATKHDIALIRGDIRDRQRIAANKKIEQEKYRKGRDLTAEEKAEIRRPFKEKAEKELKQFDAEMKKSGGKLTVSGYSRIGAKVARDVHRRQKKDPAGRYKAI